MTKQAYPVCPVADLPPGSRTIIQAGRFSIGVFNIEGEYYALRNVCPHQLAPLCEGKISGTTLPSKVGEFTYGHEGEIIHCPWHKWEFNIKTGCSVFNPHKLKVGTYQVAVQHEDGSVTTCQRNATDLEPVVETYTVGVESGTVIVYA